MVTPLLRMKLLRPALHAGLVPRLHLMQRLEQALYFGQRLILLSAPAGFGKTTLLGAWAAWMADPAAPHLPGFLADAPPLFAWLTLDAADNDLARFWSYVLAALQAAHPALRSREAGALPLLTGGPDALPAPMTQLLDELAALPVPIVLVLDDYHAITSAAVHAGLAFWLEHLPPRAHLAVATREDPPLPVGRLRARGQLTELRADDLRFTPGETAAFLNERVGLALAPDDVRALAARTEGWAAGLQLAATALAQGDTDAHAFVETFSGSHRYVLEYLLEEVYSRQSETVQRFLLETSILDRLCGPLCADVTGNPDAGKLLAQLHHANVFVLPLDAEAHWYRYHHLFAELLRDRLQREVSPQYVADLHARAGAWYENNDAAEEAVRHGLAAHDFERVAVLAERASGPAALPARLPVLRRWLAVLPPAVLDAHPRLRLCAVWLAYAGGRLAGIAEDLQGLQAAGPAVPRLPPAELGTALALWSALTGEAQRAIGEAQEALAGLPPGETALCAWANYALALAELEHGDHVAADTAGRAAEAAAGAAGNTFLAVRARSLQARAAFARGSLAEATRGHRLALDIASSAPASPDVMASGVAAVDSHLGLTELALAERDYGAAGGELAQAMEACGPGGLACDRFRALVVYACLSNSRGDTAGALVALQTASGVFSPGFSSVQPQAAESPLDRAGTPPLAARVEALCRDVAVPAPLRRYAERLLAGRAAPATPPSVPGLAEPLSAREHEVLRLVAAGRSNAQIARALTVTEHTVKKHLSNVFGKLDVSSRTQAVAKARELGLL